MQGAKECMCKGDGSQLFLNLFPNVSAGHTIDCFSCNSWSDPRCHDPFNWTSRIEDMPPIVQCEGCCVKLVRDVGTPLMSTRRTCTDALDINLFMVDHVCMTEGGGRGHMCFCEEDDCNGARTWMGSNTLIVSLTTFLCNL